jgi:hypothetical protein
LPLKSPIPSSLPFHFSSAFLYALSVCSATLHSLSTKSKVCLVSSHSANIVIWFCILSSVRFLCLFDIFVFPLIFFHFSALNIPGSIELGCVHVLFGYVCWKPSSFSVQVL